MLLTAKGDGAVGSAMLVCFGEQPDRDADEAAAAAAAAAAMASGGKVVLSAPVCAAAAAAAACCRACRDMLLLRDCCCRGEWAARKTSAWACATSNWLTPPSTRVPHSAAAWAAAAVAAATIALKTGKASVDDSSGF